MNKRIFACLLAVMMIFMCGCSATVYMDPNTGAVSVNGVAVEKYLEAAGDAKLLNLSINGIGYAGFSIGDSNDNGASDEGTGDIMILHTNDVHCGVDNNIGYAGVAAYKKEMEEEGNTVFLVDAGDEIQGGTIGSLTKGEAIINIMNDVGYDLAVPGNHDFDYGVERFLELTKMADYPYICCNFVDLGTGKTVFQPYTIQRIGERRIAFIGVVTPTTFAQSTPKYFEDENGELKYDFLQDGDGSRLYAAIQKAVDDAREDSAEYCILVSHLGIEGTDPIYNSSKVIENTTGIDAVIDGHSHSIVDGEKVKNKNGKTVLLSQAGYQIPAFGRLTIAKDGSLKSELIKEYDKKDDRITASIERERAAFKDIISEVVGTVDFDMVAQLDDDYTWIVRNNESNLADFVADAYRYATGADIAFVNGGGIRKGIKKGEITYEDILNVHPFANEMCVRMVTGQEILDALEYSVSVAPDDFGGFLQVSGITFDVDLDKDAKVKKDELGMFAGFGSDERRVSNVKVNGEALDLKKEYKAASNKYILFQKGNGFTMFEGEKVDLGRYVEDAQVLIEYLDSLGGKVPEEYRDPEGQERIHFI